MPNANGGWFDYRIIAKTRAPDGEEVFNGLIDEVGIYNRMLNASEIAALASQG